MVKYTVALIGTPNVGKSLIFNELTGGNAWVANWPGVTVEKKVGSFKMGNVTFEIVDLPGVYSLTPRSIDEAISRKFIIEEKPDVVVCVINAADLERGLYLVLSLLELGVNLVIALNMVDIARRKGFDVDAKKLSELLQAPVVPMIAVKGVGLHELKDAIAWAAFKGKKRELKINYGIEIEELIEKIERVLEKYDVILSKYPRRWFAIKLLENDEWLYEELIRIGLKELINEVNALIKATGRESGEIASRIITTRLEIARAIARNVTLRVRRSVTIDELLDNILLHKAFGVLMAIASLYLLFQFVFSVSAPLVDLIDSAFAALGNFISSLEMPLLLKSFLINGLLSGVGTVLAFTPLIILYFLAFSTLEDVGYIARIAFLLDRFMHFFNLPGRAIIPVIIGFGCNIPAIMGVRALEDEGDRRVLAMTLPLALCSARLPVVMALAYAAFGVYGSTVVAGMYVFSLLLVLLSAFLWKRLLRLSTHAGFLFELPPYTKPSLRNVLFKTWLRTRHFIIRAGTIIVALSVVVWALSVFGPGGFIGPGVFENPDLMARSWIGVLGKWLSKTIFSPLDWDWRESVALLFGFIAKENVLSVMAILYGVEEKGIVNALHGIFTPIDALAYMTFVLTYVPCVAAIGTIWEEAGSKYVALSVIYQMTLAYFFAFLIKTIGALIGLQ